MGLSLDQIRPNPYLCECGHDNADADVRRGWETPRTLAAALEFMRCEKCHRFLPAFYGSEGNMPDGTHPNPGTERSVPPWSPNQVASLNAYQACGYRHPFNCQCGAAFVASRHGWACPNCTNVQGWAHAYMTDWRWNLAFGREETQASVGAWADATFGKGTVASRAMRLLDEVVELCHAAGESGTAIESRVYRAVDGVLAKAGGLSRTFHYARPDVIPGELADCQIVLDTIGHTADVNIDAERDAKMRVNRARVWKLAGDGTGQHV